MNETEQNVMGLVNFYEQKRSIARRNAQIAQSRQARRGSADKMLSIDESFDITAMPQIAANNQFYQMNQIPATPQKQARYGYPITPQSIRRSGAPQTLSIPSNNQYQLRQQQDVCMPTTSLNNTSPTFPQFAPSSADRASFPDLDTPRVKMASHAMPSHRGHARNNSTISIASSVGSNAMYFTDSASGYGYPDPSMGYAHSSGTPPVSPKKRKSPTKSPSKGKDRPNFLDKAIMRDTGVTQEQINQYIGDPTTEDPKNWRCLWDGCTHLAARKENIRAHVQTHLGDRPYECPECHADFVRSHDFTRHYTTHVDSRDFKCPDCPQAFNRADALQRHRDRDFCNGPPPGGPNKMRRTEQAIDKKRDAAGRRSKKQVARRRNTKRQDSVELSDDFWSSSGSSPEYFSSDAGSPEVMMLDSFVDTVQNISDSQQTYMPTQPVVVAAPDPDGGQQLLDRLFAACAENGNNSNSAHDFSLSPPHSPEQSHQALTPFSPTPKRSGQKRREITPPASRDSMLAFLSSASVHGNQTVSSAASLPDLSSTSTSPLAFEPVPDFDDFCNSLHPQNDDSWLDPRFGKAQVESTFDFGDLMDNKAQSGSWMDADDLFAGL